MELIKDPKLMQKKSDELHKNGSKVALVPTMGALHEGHLSLVDKAKTCANTIVMSIYLNPTQFSPSEDLTNYPSNFEKDLELAKGRGVNIVFCPTNEAIYPTGFQTYVEATNITKWLCGKARPNHFRGVTTVVAKLFNIVKPDVAIFGQKDYQQLQVIKQMTKDLNFDIEIVGSPTIREEDGLAMSSRNAHLSPEERKAARSISQSLLWAQEIVKNGETDLCKIVSNIKEKIESTNIGKVDYIKICDPKTLEELSTLKTPALLAIAAKFGPARLIDNCIINT